MSLDAVGIVSRNLEQSAKFYGILGVELKAVGGEEHLEGETSSGVRVMVDSLELVKKINPLWKESAGSGVVLCFKQDTPKRVDEVFRLIIEAGFEEVKMPWDAFWGQRYASVSDPDGNQVDIFAPL